MAHAADPQNRSHQSELRIQASADALALLERAMQSLSQEAGRILSPGEALEYLAAEYLSRKRLDTAVLEAARHQAQQDRLAQQRQNADLAEQAERSARNIAPWNALRADTIIPHGNLYLVQRDKPHWNNPRARHLTYYSQQGTTTPNNLITLCASCHRNLHNGHLRIEGTAPQALTFLGWPGSQDNSHRARAA